jgi:hypothetical protein
VNSEVKCHSGARNGTTARDTSAASLPHELRDETDGEAQHRTDTTFCGSWGRGWSYTSTVGQTASLIVVEAFSMRFHFEECLVECITKHFITYKYNKWWSRDWRTPPPSFLVITAYTWEVLDDLFPQSRSSFKPLIGEITQNLQSIRSLTFCSQFMFFPFLWQKSRDSAVGIATG